MDHAPFPPPSPAGDAGAVLLDLDGTLVASRDGIVASLRLAMADLGHVLDPAAALDWVVGPPLHDIVDRLLAERGDTRVAAAIERYRHHYESGGLLDSPLFPGIRAALEAMAASGHRLFLATSKPLHTARRILEQNNITALFEALYGAAPDDSGAEKPELIARLVAQQRVDPARAVMVGDRRFDIAGAHANRMRAIGVLWGYGGRVELEAAGADRLVALPDRLAAAVDRMLAVTTAPSA